MSHASLAVGRQPHQGQTYLDGREETLPKGLKDATALGQAEGPGVFAEEVREPGCGLLEALLGGFHGPQFHFRQVQEGPHLGLQAQPLQVPLGSQETLLQALQFRRHLLVIDPAKESRLRHSVRQDGLARLLRPARWDGSGLSPSSSPSPTGVSCIAFLTVRQGPRAGAGGESAEGRGPSSRPPGEETKGGSKGVPWDKAGGGGSACSDPPSHRLPLRIFSNTPPIL